MNKAHTVPEWTEPDKLKKSMELAGLNQLQIAQLLGVERTTVSNWTRGRISPNVATVYAWAYLTGVDPAWIRPQLPRLDSNQEPSDYQIDPDVAPFVAAAESALGRG